MGRPRRCEGKVCRVGIAMRRGRVRSFGYCFSDVIGMIRIGAPGLTWATYEEETGSKAVALTKRWMPGPMGHPNEFGPKWPVGAATTARTARLRLNAAARHTQTTAQAQRPGM